MSEPICVKCGRPMFCRKTGRVLAERHADGIVFRLRSVDEYACDSCDAAVCLVQSQPFSERGRISSDGRGIDELLALAEQRQNVVNVTYHDGGS